MDLNDLLSEKIDTIFFAIIGYSLLYVIYINIRVPDNSKSKYVALEAYL